MKHIFIKILFLLIIFSVQSSNILLAQNENMMKIRTVVIDPGHGGKDPGALGKISTEKELTLAVALKLNKLMQENFKDVKTILTRDKDVFVELYKRAEIANKNNADLFISIHINSAQGTKAHGSETYVMGTAKSNANLAVAKTENSVVLKEDNYIEKYDGFDPNDPENHIVFSLYQNANLLQSLNFSESVQNNLKALKRFDRGVKQAGFLVLWKTTMPSVLIELGFINNPEEEKYMKSEKGQNELAQAIFNAFSNFKKLYDGDDANNAKSQNENEKNPSKIETTPESENKTSITKSNSDIIEYKVQIHTSSKKLNKNSTIFKSYKDVDFYIQNDIYKYTIGKESEYKKIEKYLKTVKKDFKDSFIVVFRNGERISLNEAKSYEK